MGVSDMFKNTIMGLSLENKKVEMLNDGWFMDEVEEYIYNLMMEIPLNCSHMTIDEYREMEEQKFNNWYEARQAELNEELPF